MPKNGEKYEAIGKHQSQAFRKQIKAIVALRNVDVNFAGICDDFEEIATHLAAEPSDSGSTRDLAHTLEALREEILQYLEDANPSKE
jgi:ribosomal protein S15P/S13E